MSDAPVDLTPERPGEAPASPDAPQESVGMIFARARAALGFSPEDVAHQLKYSVRQIDALEQDRFDRLHGATFARGMVRSYARLLRLDPEPLLERLGDKVAKPAPILSSVPFRRPIPFSNSSRRSTLAYVFLTIVILAVGATVAIEWHQERVPGASGPGLGPTSRPIEPPRASAPPPAPKVAAPTAPASGSAPGAASATGAAVPAATSGPAVPATTPAATSGSATPAATLAATSSPAMPSAASATSAPAPSAAPSTPAPNTNATASLPGAPLAPTATPAATAAATSGAAPPVAGQHRIVLVFDQKSWVEIKGADGKKLLEKLNPAGTRQVVEGKPPFSLVIGNAQHVHVTYDNHPVDLKPHTRAEVARFSLD